MNNTQQADLLYSLWCNSKYILSLHFHKAGLVFTPVLQMRKPRLKELKWLITDIQLVSGKVLWVFPCGAICWCAFECRQVSKCAFYALVGPLLMWHTHWGYIFVCIPQLACCFMKRMRFFFPHWSMIAFFLFIFLPACHSQAQFPRGP